ncbi:MAG: Gfo/Idh/MocA family oxidoreductase [Chloroflexi bacterium]|nr:Gfo/Idh/MocA family oxidoreductase [Chloroflexota bacterium]
MTKIKFALLGCGDVAQRDYLPEFHRLGHRAEIVAVCGRTEARVRAVADQYNIPHWSTDYHNLLNETDADAVINLTPIQWHKETTLAALEAGKHVYTEKPVASTVADGQRIQKLANSAGLKLVCAPCVMLFPQVRYAQALLADGAIGAVYSARGYGHMGVPPWSGYNSDPSPFFAKGGGPAMDMGVYPLHVLTGLLGPAQRVTAMVTKVLDDFIVEDGPVAGKRVPVEADDNWQMILDFGHHCLVSLAANNVVYGTRTPQVELHGLKGTIALDPIDVASPVEILQAGKGWDVVKLAQTGRAAGPDHHLGIEHLVDCIQEDRAPLLSIEHALHVVEIIEKAALSARENRTLAIESQF